MNKKKVIFVFLVLIFSSEIIYYGEMWYRRFTGNDSSGCEFYIFQSPSKNVLEAVLSFKKSHKEFWTPNDTTLFVTKNRGNVKDVYIKFYDNEKYYHTWVIVSLDSIIEKETTFVFGGVSETPYWNDAIAVNNMAYFERQETIKQFDNLLIKNLMLKPKYN